MFPLTATYYNSQQKLWSGPERKSWYPEKLTLGEVIYLQCYKNLKKIIQINDTTDEQMTAKEFLDFVTALSKNLLKMGLKQGDVVGMYSQNCTHTATVMVSSYLCGTPINAVYPGFDEDSVKIVYKVTTPKIIFCDVENYGIAYKVCQDLSLNAAIFIMNGNVEGVPNILDLVKPEIPNYDNQPFEFPCVNLHGDDTAVILCSSSTTGIPKGVLCSHRALLNNNLYPNLKSDSVISTFSTMYWASGLWNLNAGLLGCCLRIVVNKPYSPEYFLQLIERYKITHMGVNGVQMAELSMYEDVTKIKTCLASIDSFMVGGSKVPLIVQESITKIMQQANDKRPGFGLAYGMSELSGLVSYNGGYPYESKPATEGKLYPNIKARIVNKNGEFLGPNEHGEILISSPYTWYGYYRNLEASKKAYKNNWLYTGDIGFFDDDGFLHVCGRDNDIFKANNFQIYPQLIEDVVTQVPGIYAVCVFGIHDLVATNLIACAVVRKDDELGKQLTAKVISQYVASKMGSMYHLSGGVYFIDDIPKTSSGKVQRKDVLSIVQQQQNK